MTVKCGAITIFCAIPGVYTRIPYYVMQSYSLEVDPTLSEAGLPRLGERLEKPDGWRYRVRRLMEEWSLHVDGEARVIQDELRNTYQRVDPAPGLGA